MCTDVYVYMCMYICMYIRYKNIRTKVVKCCSNIGFNRQVLTKKVVPKYANIKIPYTSPATNITHKKIQTIRLKFKDEINFLYRMDQN